MVYAMIYISSGFILSAQFINFLSELIMKSLKKVLLKLV